MKHEFSQFRDQMFKELPAPLPAGEGVIWQGKPTFTGLALRSFHIREVAIYFGLVLVWKLWANWSAGVPAGVAVQSALLLMVPAISAVSVLAGLAWLYRRSACYTLTNKRVLFQFGVALPMTVNVPLDKIANAALKTYRDGSGDIPLRPSSDSMRMSYLLLWPHVRPWRLRAPEPMLTSIPDAAGVAAQLAAALTGQPGPSAIALVQATNPGSASDRISSSPASAAA
jgi:hypothetical protein